MKRSSLAALIVTVCIIAPVIVGYVMPTGETEHTSYESGNILNITGELANDKLPIYNVYEGPSNAIYTLYGDTVITPNKTTSSASAYPSMYPEYYWEGAKAGGFVPTPVVSGGTTFTLSVYSVEPSGYWTDHYNNKYRVVYVYANGRIDGFNNSTGLVDSDLKDVRLQGSAQYAITITGMMNDEYADINYGYEPKDVTWRNGYSNQHVYIILQGNGTAKVQISFGSWPNYPIVEIVDGVWRLNQTADNSPQYLGSVMSYNYVLVDIDTYLHKVSLSGLIGMRGFADDWSGKVAKTVEVGTMAYSPVVTMSLKFTGSGITGWFVPRTMAQTGTGMGLVNSVMEPGGYCSTTNSPWEVRLENPASFGDSIVLSSSAMVTMATFYVNKSNGTINPLGVSGGEIPIRGMIIDFVPYEDAYALEFNGTVVASGLTESPLITFKGNWWLQVYFTELKEYSYKTYDWEPGGFGIDATGFYSIGLLSSVGCAVAGGLSGRRSGEHAGIVLLTSAICGLIYIILLMG